MLTHPGFCQKKIDIVPSFRSPFASLRALTGGEPVLSYLQCVAALDERRDLLVARHGKIQVWQLWIDAALSAAFFLFIIYFFANLCSGASAQNRSRRGFDLGRNILVTLPSRQRVLVCASVHTSLSTAVGCIIFRDKMQFYSPAIVSSVLSLFKKLKKKKKKKKTLLGFEVFWNKSAEIQ